MDAAALAVSKKRVKQNKRKMLGLMQQSLLQAMLPWYDPRKLPEPKMYRSYMSDVELQLAQ
jgi:hypothetical protein